MAELPREERNSTMGNKRVNYAPRAKPKYSIHTSEAQASTQVLSSSSRQADKLRQVHKLKLTPADKLREAPL